ncbi:ATP-binding protein [Pseudogracilibacillus auburnensis]|uniref:histidine kinase n=1 Tax=Pseudogracilibacillus auburnensis TaxID=1494959 RepID=A0A2V3W346_9BACI|nr:ATP-binding protein [Pseudogracilibacillus auburnensis]MBO1003079.1 HAMP domain-containing protein [Pseudogracilibacillus auburnensis]PXW88717.1 PAS/PAC sensor signal transduction histidine kinase [Pseudogracilibacillus auburnensis]
MFWRSVVGKLAITILLLVSFVLFILTILLLEFFEGFHVQEAEKAMVQTATKISLLVEEHDEIPLIMEMTERVKDPTSRVIIYFADGTMWASNTTNEHLTELGNISPKNNAAFMKVITDREPFNEKITLNDDDTEIMVIGKPLNKKDGAIFVFQSLDVINQTKAETTKIIFVAAAIAIVLTTIFAFFLSTRITAPLIQMREAAIDLAKGEFNTKLPVVSHDEIGELAIAFNRMGRQLNFHINALRQEKEQLTSIVNSMADGVITFTREGHIIVINPPAEQFIQDWNFENNIRFDEYENQLPDELMQILQQVIKEEKEVLQELNLQGRDWVMIMTPLYDNSYIRGAVAVIRDMTEERQLDKLRKDFISNVSHELRTPIALMQGYSEAIVDDIAESVEDKNELAKIIHEESLRMGRLVNELLDIGRMEAGHIELNLETIEVEQFIQRIYKKFIGMAEENNIELKLTKEMENKLITIDSDRIEQVFTNLIDNALGHTRPSGYVHIFVRSMQDYFYVEVEDNGTGIPEEDLSFIFERFYKADKSRTRTDKKKGTGLGLAIAKHIISAHDGIISVKSRVNEGTTFSFKVPQNQGKLAKNNDN